MQAETQQRKKQPLQANLAGAGTIEIEAKVWDAPENLVRNVRHSIGLGLPELFPQPEHDGTLCIVGSGPSLKHAIEDLRRHQRHTIMCVNGAHNWLMEHHILPHFCTTCDSCEEMAQIITPNLETKYLVASQCHPAYFERLRGCHVTLWHSWAGEEHSGFNLEQILDEDGAKSWIIMPAGGTAALTCFNIGHFLGYRKFRLYGLDSSYADDGSHHCNSDPAGPVEVKVSYNGKTYRTGLAFAYQAVDFEQLYCSPEYNNCRIDAIGDGLIPDICRHLNRLKHGAQHAGNADCQ